MEQNYIKARPQLAKALGVDGIRNKFPDGNYLLYWADPHKKWGWGDYAKMLEETGSRVMTPAEARDEMDGGVSAPLPQPTDIRWSDLAQGLGNGTSAGEENPELPEQTEEQENPDESSTTDEVEPTEGDEV